MCIVMHPIVSGIFRKLIRDFEYDEFNVWTMFNMHLLHAEKCIIFLNAFSHNAIVIEKTPAD